MLWNDVVVGVTLQHEHVNASAFKESRYMRHGDRYIGSLFRVDEPVPDDSLDLQLVGKFGDDVI